MVRARSAAEIPVVTPSRASIEMVKAVSCRDSLRRSIIVRPSCSVRIRVKARQINPRPYLAMKLIASAVAYSPITHRSPSFSRSSSSTRMKSLPALASAITSSIVDNPLRLGGVIALILIKRCKAGNIARQHINFHIHLLPDDSLSPAGDIPAMLNDI